MYSINGKFLLRKINGQIRVAIETIKELDELVPKDYVEIVAPESDYSIDGLHNIKIIRIGKGNPYLWEQFTFYAYIKKHKRIGINILNSHPVLRPDISYIHDTFFSAYPNVYKTKYGKAQKRFSLIMEKSAVKRAKAIIAVSEFTKSEIIKYHNVDSNKIFVIYNGWQHMDSIEEDTTVFDDYSVIRQKEYYLAASGITPQKNFKWILENAKRNPDLQFVIVGQREKSTQETIEDLQNVIFTGRVSDERLKALMHFCKAFIHPAIYEGFGLTPMEAIASGCKKVILAKTSCLPEIYGDCAYYIDPNITNIRLDELLSKENNDTSIILEKYGWHKAASDLYKVLEAFE